MCPFPSCACWACISQWLTHRARTRIALMGVKVTVLQQEHEKRDFSNRRG